MKMGLMQRLKGVKENKKGFTLVEMIAVIVIMGILMAIMVPNFLNYMNKANAAEDQVKARALYIAATTLAAEEKYDPDDSVTAWGTACVNVITLSGYETTDITGTLIIGFTASETVAVTYQTASAGTITIPAGAEIDDDVVASISNEDT